MPYTIYCDGASRKDGRGGWGAHIRFDEPKGRVPTITDICGGEFDTTNNRMELLAVIEALWFIRPGSSATIYCDSKYVVDGVNEHMLSWEWANWRTSANKPVKNLDLWQELKAAIETHESVELKWVRGHNGNEGNERADYLAGRGVPASRSEPA